jgi:hypothetical protein
LPGQASTSSQSGINNELAYPQFIIECPIESWRVFGVLDDTDVWTCRPGSGPVGNRDGPGRP